MDWSDNTLKMVTKPKVVEIINHIGRGCGSQISKKQDYVTNPLSVLEKKDFICEIWTTERKGVKFYGNFRVRRFPNTFSLLLHLLLDKDIQLVYSQLRAHLPSLLAPLSLKKCVLMTQTYELGSNWLRKKFSLFFMKRFSRIFALTPYERQLYIKNGLKKEKVVFAPHAIDHSFFSEKPKLNLDKVRKRYGIDKDDFVVIAVSNFRKFKNLDTMIGAFALLHNKVKKSKMLVVGDDQTGNKAYKEQYSKRYSKVENAKDVVKREKISKEVIFTGGLGYKDVRDLLYISNVFVNSSDPEGMGMAVYEAASAGLPLCLSDIGSFTSVFRDMALYNSPRDDKKLAENYLNYYKNPNLRKRIGKRLMKYTGGWDYPIAIKRFEKNFSDVLS